MVTTAPAPGPGTTRKLSNVTSAGPTPTLPAPHVCAGGAGRRKAPVSGRHDRASLNQRGRAAPSALLPARRKTAGPAVLLLEQPWVVAAFARIRNGLLESPRGG